MITCVREPLEFYVNKLERNEPFSSLLYGDGEWIACLHLRTRERLSYGEVVSVRLEQEMLASLDVVNPNIIRATDLNLVEYQKYKGNDYKSVEAYGIRINHLLNSRGVPITLYDGTVWETASEQGQLSPLLKVLKTKKCLMVAHPVLGAIAHVIRPNTFIAIPPTNAYGDIDRIEAEVVAAGEHEVYIVCMGLGAIPMIMRLLYYFPNATFLDLGSTFDVFVGLPTRGWRKELYLDQAKWEETVRLNTEGVY